MARFVMNAMLASGGDPWPVIRVEDRDAYLAALDRASIDPDIAPFAIHRRPGPMVLEAGLGETVGASEGVRPRSQRPVLSCLIIKHFGPTPDSLGVRSGHS